MIFEASSIKCPGMVIKHCGLSSDIVIKILGRYLYGSMSQRPNFEVIFWFHNHPDAMETCNRLPGPSWEENASLQDSD